VGNARVEFRAQKNELEIVINGVFAEMLHVFKECKQCCGPSYFRSSWRNPDYFRYAEYFTVNKTSSTISCFTVHDISEKQAQRFQKIAHHLQFVLEGVIGGLSDGRIALHASGNLIKSCREPRQNHNIHYPITLKIIKAGTGESLAIFTMRWDCL
jgi:hypothetical protein